MSASLATTFSVVKSFRFSQLLNNLIICYSQVLLLRAISTAAQPITPSLNAIPSSDKIQLMETNLPNLFASLQPADELLLPIFTAVDDFGSKNADVASPAPANMNGIKSPIPLESIGLDNVVLSEIVDGVHRITSDRESFEFRLRAPVENDVILTENAIVSGDGHNFLVAFPVDPDQSIMAATVVDSPNGENPFSLPEHPPSPFDIDSPAVMSLFALPVTASLTSFSSTD